MSAIRIVLATVGVALCHLIDNPASSQNKDTGTNMRPWTVTHGGTSSSATGKQFKSSKYQAKSGDRAETVRSNAPKKQGETKKGIAGKPQ